ncbi:MAG: hypothetical protein HGJ91_13660 [Desulfobacula sp.]|nr:hypothetical protein [Desulfobacula sp.]
MEIEITSTFEDSFLKKIQVVPAYHWQVQQIHRGQIILIVHHIFRLGFVEKVGAWGCRESLIGLLYRVLTQWSVKTAKCLSAYKKVSQ